MDTPTPCVKLDVQLRVGDLYWLYVTRAARVGWFVRGYAAIVLIVLAASTPENLSFLVPLVRPPFVYFVLSLFAYYLLVKPYFDSRAVARRSADATHYVFGEAGIDVTGAHSQAHYTWSAVQRARQTSQLVVLYLNQYSALILPKRCFVSSEQLLSLYDLITKKVKKKAGASTPAVSDTK